jgi:hypothetical protein
MLEKRFVLIVLVAIAFFVAGAEVNSSLGLPGNGSAVAGGNDCNGRDNSCQFATDRDKHGVLSEFVVGFVDDDGDREIAIINPTASYLDWKAVHFGINQELVGCYEDTLSPDDVDLLEFANGGGEGVVKILSLQQGTKVPQKGIVAYLRTEIDEDSDSGTATETLWLNIPLQREEYEKFLRDFDNLDNSEGCTTLPVDD